MLEWNYSFQIHTKNLWLQLFEDDCKWRFVQNWCNFSDKLCHYNRMLENNYTHFELISKICSIEFRWSKSWSEVVSSFSNIHLYCRSSSKNDRICYFEWNFDKISHRHQKYQIINHFSANKMSCKPLSRKFWHTIEQKPAVLFQND